MNDVTLFDAVTMIDEYLTEAEEIKEKDPSASAPKSKLEEIDEKRSKTKGEAIANGIIAGGNAAAVAIKADKVKKLEKKILDLSVELELEKKKEDGDSEKIKELEKKVKKLKRLKVTMLLGTAGNVVYGKKYANKALDSTSDLISLNKEKRELKQKEEENKEEPKTESALTDQEKEEGARKEETIKKLKTLNNTGIAVSAIGAGCAAILAGEYALAMKKTNDEIKKLSDEIAKEKEKKDPDTKKISDNEKKIKKLNRAKIIISAYLGGVGVAGGKYLYKVGKGTKRNDKLDDMAETARAEKNVVATYDKNGNKED